MRRSEEGEGFERNIVDDSDNLHLYSEIKELLRANFQTFDDLLQKMGKAQFTQENVVTFKDFETLVRSMPQTSKFSSQQLRSVFMTYAHGMSAQEAFMKSIDFKDKFFPGIHWQRQSDINDLVVRDKGKVVSGASSSDGGSVSMHVDNILAGVRHEDLSKKPDDIQAATKILKEKEMKYQGAAGQSFKGMPTIKEDRLEAAS